MTTRTALSRVLGVAAALACLHCGGKEQISPSGTDGGAGSAGASGSGGAAGTGGSAGQAGAGGSGGATVDSGTSKGCVTDTDCTLINDCCACIALPTTVKPPTCGAPECFAPSCEANGLSVTQVKCAVNTCILGVQCAGVPNCKPPTPNCPAGQVPSINQNTSCWGGCVPADQCASVDSCDICTAQQFSCVMENGQAHCVPFGPD